MPADEANLVLYAPGLDDPRVDFKRRYEDFKHFELGHWLPTVGTSPEAGIILFRYDPIAPRGMTFVREPPLEKRIRQWFRSENIEMGAGGKYKNVLGGMEYVRFTRDGATQCVFMRQYGDTYSDQRGYFSDGSTGHGNIMIRGYYCVAPFHELSQGTLERFLYGIGLKGFGVPEKPADLTLTAVPIAGAAAASGQRQSASKGAHQAIFEDYGTPHYRDGQIYDYYTGIATGTSGDIIVAAAAGTVDYVASSANQERIIIYHGRDENGLHVRTEYWYHQAIFAKEGETVTRGQQIGIVGGQKRQFLYFRVVKAPENLYGSSSVWIPENPHDYWLDGSGKITCFDPGTVYSQKSSMKLTWPLKCR